MADTELNPNIRAKLLEEVPLELQKGIPSLSPKEPKPLHWASRANAPYYKERFAMQMKSVLDDMESSRTDIVFRYSEHPKISRNTLYLRINQSLLYLFEKLDKIPSPTDGAMSVLGKPLYHYGRLRELITITREQSIGVRLSFEEGSRMSELGNLKPSHVISKLETPKWKMEMENFIDTGLPGTRFVKKNLALTDEEVTDIKVSLAQLTNIIAKITSAEIIIIKREE